MPSRSRNGSIAMIFSRAAISPRITQYSEPPASNFLVALRRHPGDVNVMARQAFFLGRLHAFGDPAFEFLHGVAADGKLDEMKRHDLRLAFGVGFWKDQSSRGAAAGAGAPGAGGKLNRRGRTGFRRRLLLGCGRRPEPDAAPVPAHSPQPAVARRGRRGGERRFGRHDIDRRGRSCAGKIGIGRLAGRHRGWKRGDGRGGWRCAAHSTTASSAKSGPHRPARPCWRRSGCGRSATGRPRIRPG